MRFNYGLTWVDDGDCSNASFSLEAVNMAEAVLKVQEIALKQGKQVEYIRGAK